MQDNFEKSWADEMDSDSDEGMKGKKPAWFHVEHPSPSVEPVYIKPKVSCFINHTKDVMVLRPSNFAGKRGVITEFLPTMYLVEFTSTIVKLLNDGITDYSKNAVGDATSSGVISGFIDSQYITSCDTNESYLVDDLGYQKETIVQYTKDAKDIHLFGITSGSVVYSGMVVIGVNSKNHNSVIPKMVKDGSMRFSGKSTETPTSLYAFINEGEGHGMYCRVKSVTKPKVELKVNGVMQFSKNQIDWIDEEKLKGTLKDTAMETKKIHKKIHKHANIEIDGTVYTKHTISGKKENFERIHYVHNDALYTDKNGAKKVVEIITKKENKWFIRVGNENITLEVGDPNLLIYSDFRQLNNHLFSMFAEPPRFDSPEPYRPESPTYQPESPSRVGSPGSEKSFDENAGDSESETESVGYNECQDPFVSSFQDSTRVSFNPETLSITERPIFNRILKVLRMVSIDSDNVEVKNIIDQYLVMEEELYNILLDIDKDEDFTLEERAFLLLPLVYNEIVEIIDMTYPEFVQKILGFQFKKDKSKKMKMYNYKNEKLENSIWLNSTWYKFTGCREKPRFKFDNESLGQILERVFCFLERYGVTLNENTFDESLLIPLANKRKIIMEDIPISQVQLYKTGFKKQRITDSQVRKLEKEQKEMGANVFPDGKISTNKLDTDFIDPQELKDAWQDYWKWQESEGKEKFLVQEEKEDTNKSGTFEVFGREREPRNDRKSISVQKRKTRLERLNPHSDFSLKKQIIRTKQSISTGSPADKERLMEKLASLEEQQTQETLDKLARKFKGMSVKDRKTMLVKEFFVKVKSNETPEIFDIIKANWKDKIFINSTPVSQKEMKAKNLIMGMILGLREINLVSPTL
jgi:hypothetical protein